MAVFEDDTSGVAGPRSSLSYSPSGQGQHITAKDPLGRGRVNGTSGFGDPRSCLSYTPSGQDQHTIAS